HELSVRDPSVLCILSKISKMIVITGAAGFIGSALVAHFNGLKIYDAALVDDFSTPMRLRNLAWKYYGPLLQRDDLQTFLLKNASVVEAVIHLGGKSGYFHEDWEWHRKVHLETAEWL